MKKIIRPGIVLICTSVLFAADINPWSIDIDANATVTQNAYSDSWIGGEKGALSWASKLTFIAEKQVAPWMNHRNTLKLHYGQTKTQNEDKSWGEFSKSADLIDFETRQLFTISKYVDPFVAVRVISQFVDERDSLHRHYGNPIDITESFGVSRILMKQEHINWDARVGAAIHQAVDRYYYDAGKAEHVTDVVNNAGFELVTEMKASLRDGLFDYKGFLTLFQAVVSSDAEDDNADGTPYWQYPDVNWENIFSVNITKYVMVNMTVQLLYDREKHEDVRLKEVMALGLTYKFTSKAEQKTP